MRSPKPLDAVVASHGGLVTAPGQPDQFAVTMWLRVTAGPATTINRSVVVTMSPDLARTVAASLTAAARRTDESGRASETRHA